MSREESFKNQYIGQWEELENLIVRIKKKGYSSFSPEELRRYLELLKNVSHHLAYVRTHFPSSPLSQYLNELSVRGTNHLYVVKKTNIKAALSYFTTGFPMRLRKYRHYFYLSTGLFMLGFIVSFLLVMIKLENATFFVPQEFLARSNWESAEAAWPEETFTFLSGSIMINNIFVTLKTFAYGISAGIMTIYVLITNGGMMGGLTGVVAQHTSNLTGFLSLILPHGIIELTAIFISGASGLMIGKALLIPGQFKRKDALVIAAKEAVMLMPGVIMMLVIAGLIEGFLTPAKISVNFKLSFAALTAVMLLVYFLPLRKKKDSL